MSVIYKDGQFYGAQSVKDIFLPVGSIIPMMSNHAPKNTLICDGTVYNIADYLQLANFFESEFGSINYFGGDGTTTFAVPDLKGEFLRGSGTNGHSGQGSGTTVGTHQDSSQLPRVVTNDPNVTSTRNSIYFSSQKGSLNALRNADNLINITTDYVDVSVTRDELINRTGEQTYAYNIRPTNTSVLYVIVYKNIYADVKDLFTAGDGINISEESEISTDNMPSADMSEIITPLPSVQPGRVRYSTTEQVVGTWIDGKPLYQKTIEYNVVVAASYSGSDKVDYAKTYSELGIPSVANIVNYTGIVQFPSNNNQKRNSDFCYIGSNANQFGMVSILASSITYSTNVGDATLALPLRLTIQYTKTTD